MSTGSFGSTGTSTIGFTDQWVHAPGVTLPTGRNTMFNGTAYALVTSLGAFVSGKGASRLVALGIEGIPGTGVFSVSSAGSAADTGAQACSFLTAGGTGTYRITATGSFYFGRGTGGTGGPSSDSHGSSFTNIIYGYYTYVSCPTAPLTPAVSTVTSSSSLVSWTAPSDNGDSAVTGYRVDYSTSPTFASAITSLEVGNVLSYTVTGLAPTTTYYFRVFAENAATTAASSWSQPSATVSLASGAGGAPPTATFALSSAPSCAFTYPTASAGVWSFWMSQSAASWFVSVTTAGTFGGTNLLFGVDPTTGFWASTTTASNPLLDGPAYLPAAGFPGSHRFAVAVSAVFAAGTWTFPLSLYVDGIKVATGASTTLTPPATFTNASRQPTLVQVGTLGTVGSAVISRLSHTLNLNHEEYATQPTEAGYISAAAATTAQVTLGTLPTDLSTAPVGYLVSAGQSALDAMNLIARTEQAYMDCTTTGSVTNPIQTVRVRARQRPATVSYTFDAQAEIVGSIDFIRDSTNLIWSDVVNGTNASSQTVSQLALQPRAGSNNASDTVATYRQSDLYEFGTDRLWRGQNVALRPVSVTIDNIKCPTDRSSDLLNMAPGDRIQIYNIPSGVIGFSTWDGWLLDKEQSHTSGPAAEDRFILYLQPAQPATGIYDTDLYANGGNNTISTALTNVATSMLCTSADVVTLFETSAVNYYLQVDSEVVKVTACSAPVAGVQTLTITRAQFSTAAAAHSVGVVPEVYADSTGRLNNGIYAF